MTKDFFNELVEDRVVILDGATGSNLMKEGMPIGVCPEKWILDNPEVLINLQSNFIKAGSDIVLAPTFTANRIKLAEYGLEDDIVSINEKLVNLSKEAIRRNNRGYVAGDITMTGKQLYPMGNMLMDELIDVYKEQASILVNSGVDLFIVETMMSLAEARAAIIAIKEVCNLPIMVSMTFNDDGKTLFGSSPEASVVVLQSLGADAVGINCSAGPDKMIPLIEKMLDYAKVPVFAKPNNGMPELIDGVTQYTMTADTFAKYAEELLNMGIRAIGGCCGTTPEHIAAVKKLVNRINCFPERKIINALAGERSVLPIDINGRFLVVGERINPTGKKMLQESLRNGSMEIVSKMAEEQNENGADLLDINMGMNGIDELDMMKKAIYEVTSITNLPLCIDSSHIDVIEEALKIYPGRALINSISLETAKCRPLMKIASKYGAMIILLPLSDKGLPDSIEEKIDILHQLLNIADEYGIKRDSIIVDGLVATVGANKKAALETLQTIEYCKNELKLPTICGLSNISFGLPERINVNTAFLTMAIKSGLTMAICNPAQSTLMNAAYASDLLLAKENSDNRYVENVIPVSSTANITKDSKDKNIEGSTIYLDIVKGNKSSIVSDCKKAIESGVKAQDIIDNDLIPGINKVGELFEKKKYFLPQLIAGATAMDMAVDYLTPILGIKENDSTKGTVVIATVEGDIHDIGKNLVVLMLKNYGYKVIDLGKDVPLETIINKSKENNADVIGLSALMTTTMMRMKDVVDYVRENNLPYKVIIGGAVVSQNFADEIGADGFSKDANEAVKLVDKLLTLTL